MKTRLLLHAGIVFSTLAALPHAVAAGLDQAEVRQLITGRTIEVDRGERAGVRIRLDADGRAWANYKDGIGAMRTNSGTWSFDDRGRFCLDWRSDGGAPQGCFHFVRDGQQLRMEKKNKEFSRTVTVD